MEAKAQALEAKVPFYDGKQALDYAIAAAELYMKAAAQAKNAPDRARLKAKCEQLIATAEGLRSSVDQSRASIRPDRQLPGHEKALLRISSILHGAEFPIWVDSLDQTLFRLQSGQALYSDSSNFSLSKEQAEIFDGWKRPSEIWGDLGREDGRGRDSLMVPSAVCDLVQDITTDCSVVSSLCASMRYLNRDIKPLLSALMFPFDHLNRRPAVSENGRYVFRMYFNGSFRQVSIDDRLPASRSPRSLFVIDRQNPHLMWPALMEKAYLKVRGGYDFPGSNSGTDLWILTGWIPEQLFLQSDEFDIQTTWARLIAAHRVGDVIITLGTRSLSHGEEEALGLVGDHDYAVMELEESAASRRLLVKNPWVDGVVWKGVGSLSANNSAPGGDLDRMATSLTGSFWIALEDVVQNFESLYLNWNPELFTNRQDHHFAWQLPSPTVALSLSHNPQYSVYIPKQGLIWVLLSRHFQDKEHALIRGNVAAKAAGEKLEPLGFMSLFIAENDGKRIQLSERATYRGPYVDSPQVLAKIDGRAGAHYTVVVAQQSLQLPSYIFTLSFLSHVPLTIKDADHEMRHYKEVTGSWTRRTAGGNPSSATYFQNPQFAIAVTGNTPMSILLSTNDEDVRVRVDLTWAAGKRVTTIAVKDLVGTSGDYRRGSTVAEIASVDQGTFTAVCSTFEPGQLCNFSLRIGAMVPCDVRPLLPDGAGRLKTSLPSIVFRDGQEKAKAAVSISRLTKLVILATYGTGTKTLPAAGKHCPIRVTLEYGQGPDKIVLTETGDGDFMDAAAGLRTDEVDVEPVAANDWGLWLFIERLGSSDYEQEVALEALSDSPVYVATWHVI